MLYFFWRDSKFGSEISAAERDGPLPSLKGIVAARVHKSAPEKATHPQIKESLLLHRAGCSHSKSACQPCTAEQFWSIQSLKGISAV